MKKLMITIAMLAFLSGAVMAQEKKEDPEKKSDPIGLSFGTDYYSNYLWRGTKFFDGDGAFIPKLAWNAFNSGLVFTAAMELSSSWVLNGFSEKPGKYDYSIDSSGKLVRESDKYNKFAYATQSLDFGVDYSYTFNDAVTVGAGVWYWWYFNSRHASEYAHPRIDGLGMKSHVDISFVTTTVFIGLPIVPFVNPILSVTHDYYTALRKGGDYYVQMGLNHPFELTKEVALMPALTVGYYYNKTAESTRYTLMVDPETMDLDRTASISYSGGTRTVTLGGIKKERTPVKKGFSDITPSLSLTFTKGPVSLNGGFYWCYVPARTWQNNAEVHRFYAKLGASCSL